MSETEEIIRKSSQQQRGYRSLVLGRSLLLGGTEKQTIFLTHALRKKGEAILVCLYDEAEERMLHMAETYGVRPLFLKGSWVRKIISVAQYVGRNDIDLVIATLPITNLIAGIIGIMTNGRVLGGFRNCLEYRKVRLYGTRFLNRYVFEGMIANSETGVRFLRENGFKEEKVACVPNAIDVERYERRERQSRGQTVRLVTVGRMVPQKNYSLALEVFVKAKSRARERGWNLRYDIVGYGTEEGSISALIHEWGLANEVQIRQGANDVTERLAAADIYLCTSHYEGMPNTIMEAMASGLPVVTTPAGDAGVLVQDGVNGFVARGWESKELASLVGRLAGSKDLREKMGSAGRLRMMEEFSLDRLDVKITRALKDLELQPVPGNMA